MPMTCSRDIRSLALHRAVASMIRENPALLDKVRAWLGRLAEKDPGAYYIAGWREVLEHPLEDILDFLVDEGEWAADLRQSSPFTGCGLLDPRDRWALLKTVERRENH